MYTNRFDRIHIICRPVIKYKMNGIIGMHNVQIPYGFFKALLVEDHNGYQSIGFYYDNVPDKYPLPLQTVSVDSIEAITGLDLFVNLPNTIQEKLEAGFDVHFWFDR